MARGRLDMAMTSQTMIPVLYHKARATAIDNPAVRCAKKKTHAGLGKFPLAKRGIVVYNTGCIQGPAFALAALTGELAVPCCLQSALAGVRYETRGPYVAETVFSQGIVGWSYWACAP